MTSNFAGISSLRCKSTYKLVMKIHIFKICQQQQQQRTQKGSTERKTTEARRMETVNWGYFEQIISKNDILKILLQIYRDMQYRKT